MAVGSSTTPSTLDARMWRRLRARCHPDGGGDHELFVWVDVLQTELEGKLNSRVRVEQPEPPANYVARFIKGCLKVHAEALEPLIEWWDTFGEYDESPAATPKQVARIAHSLGMTSSERYSFYDTCEAFGLSRAAASYLIDEWSSYG